MLARLLLLNNDGAPGDPRGWLDDMRTILRLRRAASAVVLAVLLASLAGWIPVVPLVLPVLALLVVGSESQIWQLAGRRAVAARERASEAATDLYAARQIAEQSQQRIEQLRVEHEESAVRQTAELKEQNRHLASMNAVSFALSGSMDEDGATERALQMIARVLEVPAAELYLTPDDGSEAEHIAVTVDTEAQALAIGVDEMVKGVELTGPAAFDGSPSTDGVAGPVGGLPAFAIGPLITKGRVIGSLAAVGDRPSGWDTHSLRMLGSIGRELAVTLENERLYRAAVDGAAREAVLSDVAPIIASGEFTRSLSEALNIVRASTDGVLAALLLNPGRGRPAELAVVATDVISDELRRAIESSLPGLISLVSDRTRPLVLGRDGEVPLSDTLQQAGAGNLVIVPVDVSRSATADDAVGDGDPEALPLIHVTGAVLVFATAADATWDPRSVELFSRLSTIVARRLEADAFVRLQERRLAELAGLAKVDEAIQSTIDPGRLYSGFASAVHDLVPYTRMYVARIDHDGELEEVMVFGAGGAMLEAPAIDPADVQHEWFALRSATRWRGSDSLPGFIDGRDRHGLVAPMRPKGQPLGVVVLTTVDAPHDQQGKLLRQAAEHLALALDSASLYRQATERAARLQVFGNLAATVASVVDLRDSFPDFADEMRWIVPFDRALMLLLDAESGEIEEYAACPPIPVDRRAARTLIGSTPLSTVVSEGRAITLDRADPELAHLNWKPLGLDAQSVAALPITRNGKTEAIFAIVRHTQDPFGAEEVLALEEVAGLISVSIDRMRLYERAEFHARHDTLTGLPNRRFLDERLASLRPGGRSECAADDGHGRIQGLQRHAGARGRRSRVEDHGARAARRLSKRGLHRTGRRRRIHDRDGGCGQGGRRLAREAVQRGAARGPPGDRGRPFPHQRLDRDRGRAGRWAHAG